MHQYVVTLSCPDTTGIVARISGFLAAVGGWITEAGYHSDPESGWFFTRQVVRADSLPFGADVLRARFASIAAELHSGSSDWDTGWTVTDTAEPKRVVVLVSSEAHCLHDLLGRVTTGELPARLVAVVADDEAFGDLVRAHGVAFHHVPFPRPGADPALKGKAFAELAKLVDEHEPHAVVLARFVRHLPPDLCAAWSGRAINIQHSFLPSFFGARPYHQAYARGVKLIGATCQYVTSELDAGPIIEQDVIRVDHGDTAADMVRRGRDIERLVLARGLRWHLEDRVLVHGNKTVVFR